MSIVIRDFNTMVDGILDSIVAYNVGITDTGKGSVVRAIVESIVSELDMQYYQIGNVYDALLIDEANGDDLDRTISILGVVRNPATVCISSVRFGRSTPATQDIPIPVGTVVSTKINQSGKTIEFATTEYGQINVGATYADIPVSAVEAGHITVGVNQVVRMSVPIMSVDTVTNLSSIDGGTDAEDDDSLRNRARLALQGLGKATDSALQSAVKSVEGVTQVLVLDRNRGTGTCDISVVCSSVPVPQTIKDKIEKAVADNKASGIDVKVIYPTIKYIDVIVTITYDSANNTFGVVETACGNSILKYTNGLGVGSAFVLTQMQRAVLNSTDAISDIAMTTPSANVTATTSEIIRVRNITINGDVWYVDQAGQGV